MTLLALLLSYLLGSIPNGLWLCRAALGKALRAGLRQERGAQTSEGHHLDHRAECVLAGNGIQAHPHGLARQRAGHEHGLAGLRVPLRPAGDAAAVVGQVGDDGFEGGLVDAGGTGACHVASGCVSRKGPYCRMRPNGTPRLE
mgnify:CR=1 FL=1